MALATLFSKVGATPTIISSLEQAYNKVETVAYLTSQSYVRSSSLSNICARQEVLVSQEQLVRERKIDPGFQVILNNGHAIHYMLQNYLLPDIGVLRGHWKCLECCHVHKKESESLVESTIHRPEICRCGGKEFLYQELSLKDETLRLTGHVDGVLRLTGREGLGVLEAKSISLESAWKVAHSPMLEHLIQINAYMYMLGLKWGMILYWNKGANGMQSLIEHVVLRDAQLMDSIKATLADLWYGLEKGVVPERTVCATQEAPKALECPVRVKCFALTP